MSNDAKLPWVTVAVASRELQISRQRVAQLIASGGLAGRMSGNLMLVSTASIEARRAKAGQGRWFDGNGR